MDQFLQLSLEDQDNLLRSLKDNQAFQCLRLRMAQVQAINSTLKGKELEMECVRYALFQEGVNAVFKEIDAIVDEEI